MTPDRRQQVKTTKERHGKDHYQVIGAKSSGAGQHFRKPGAAAAASKVRWDKKRKERDDASKQAKS